MKNTILTSSLVLALILSSCNQPGNKKTGSGTDPKIDSCEIALPFEDAKAAQSMAGNDYSGDINNYWGDDSAKLDFKHVFKKGKLVSSYFYYENQTVQEQYSFKCGALHGTQKWFYENGQLAKTIPYSYGYRNGTGQLYDEDGHLIQKITFRNDSVIGEVQNFDHSGKRIQDKKQ